MNAKWNKLQSIKSDLTFESKVYLMSSSLRESSLSCSALSSLSQALLISDSSFPSFGKYGLWLLARILLWIVNRRISRLPFSSNLEETLFCFELKEVFENGFIFIKICSNIQRKILSQKFGATGEIIMEKACLFLKKMLKLLQEPLYTIQLK